MVTGKSVYRNCDKLVCRSDIFFQHGYSVFVFNPPLLFGLPTPTIGVNRSTILIHLLKSVGCATGHRIVLYLNFHLALLQLFQMPFISMLWVCIRTDKHICTLGSVRAAPNTSLHSHFMLKMLLKPYSTNHSSSCNRIH